MNKLPFPKIDPKVFDREGLKECYVFKPKKGEKNCPTVIHFVLVNINFRQFKAPGKYVHMWSFPQHARRGKYARVAQYYYNNPRLPSWHMSHRFLEVVLWNWTISSRDQTFALCFDKNWAPYMSDPWKKKKPRIRVTVVFCWKSCFCR